MIYIAANPYQRQVDALVANLIDIYSLNEYVHAMFVDTWTHLNKSVREQAEERIYLFLQVFLVRLSLTLRID